MNQQIQEFNKKLIDINIFDINIIDYINAINNEFFKIDISFIDDFINLVDKEGFIINHDMLIKYEVLAKNSDSAQVARILKSYDFEEGIDYSCNVAGSEHSSKDKIIYMLKQDVFKMILMRSKHTRKYAEYYIMLEKSIKYFSDYEKMKLQKKIQENNKIKLLELKQSSTLDNFIIFKDIRNKYYQYGTIKGSDKNVRETLIDLKLTDDDILLKLKVPSQQNFNKKIKEILKYKYVREKFYIRKLDKKKFNGEENHPTDGLYFSSSRKNDSDYDEDDEYIVSTTRYFKLLDITIYEFIENINDIDITRYNN